MNAAAMTQATLVTATILQAAAIAVALLLFPRSERHVAWGLLTAALIVQGLRRLYVVLNADVSPLYEAFTALGASMFVLAGMVALRSLMVTNAQASEDLSRAHADAELYLDVTGAIIVVMDAQGRFLRINEQGRKVLGLEEDQNIDADLWFASLTRPDVSDELSEGFHAFMHGEKGDDEYVEYPVLTPRGEERHILWHRHLVRDEQGYVTGIVSAGIDMTGRREAEREAAFGAFLLDQTSDAVIVTDVEGGWRIVYANDAACELADLPRTRIVGADVRSFLTKEWMSALEGRQLELRRSGSVIGRLEAQFAEGEPIPVEVHSRAIEAEGRQLVVSVLRDLRARRSADAVPGEPL